MRWIEHLAIVTIALVLMPAAMRAEEGQAKAKEQGQTVREKAQKKSATEKKSSRVPQNNGIEVMPLDPNFPTGPLQSSGYRVNMPDRKGFPTQVSDVPDPQVRDQILHDAGLSGYVKDWDHLERDILFLRAQQQTLRELVAKYPGFPKRSLQALKKYAPQSGGVR